MSVEVVMSKGALSGIEAELTQNLIADTSKKEARMESIDQVLM